MPRPTVSPLPRDRACRQRFIPADLNPMHPPSPKRARLALASLPILLAPPAASAELVAIRFDAGGPVDPSTPYRGGGSTVADGLSTEGLSVGPGFEVRTRYNRFELGGTIDGGSQSGSLAESIDDQEFVTLTVAPDAGRALDLAGGRVELLGLKAEGDSAATAFEHAGLFSSVDGFAEADAIARADRTAETGDLALTLPDEPRYEAITEPIELRVVFSRTTPATSGGGGFQLRADTASAFVLHGEVVDADATAAPEPPEPE